MSQTVHTVSRRRVPASPSSIPASCRYRGRGVYSSVLPFPKRMNSETFDQPYIDALVAGRPDIQDHFTAYFGDLLYLKVRANVRSTQLREDIIQDTFLRAIAFLQRGHLDHPERLGAFMCRVCENTTKEHFRKLARDINMAEGQEDPADESVGSEERLVSEERKRSVRNILEEMPDKDRRLLRALYIEERDKDEVCREFKVDRNYLRVLLHRAKARFRESLERGGSSLLAALLP